MKTYFQRLILSFFTSATLSTSFFLFSFSSPLLSQIELPSIIGDHMVLQQQTGAPIWGWADPGRIITVKTSWDDRHYVTTATPDGMWMVVVLTPEAGGPHSIRINDRVLEDVMIGEVWVCSGQSNMQWAVRQALNADQEIVAAGYPDIRLFYAAREFDDEPKKDCYGNWTACQPSTAESFSAVAYFFGRELHRELDIPVGLIHTSWGGTPAQAWTRKEVLKRDPALNVYLERFREKVKNAEPGILPLNQGSPASLYNAMIAPLIPFAVKGAIWYQGEANVQEAKRYETLFPAMIRNWRTDWNRGDFPFYYVQLAPYNYETPVVGAALRDAQRKTLSLANTGMAVTLDIGDPNDIHPKNKQEVGRRLALWALANDYGKKDVVYSGPLFRSMNVEGKKARLNFEHVGKGFMVKGETITHFEIAGKDRIFYPADARIDGKTIVVSSRNVSKPEAVRFAFNNTDEPNLFNAEGLPASSFRTDDWPLFVETVKVSGMYDADAGQYVVTLSCSNPALDIRYTTDGSEPDINSSRYEGPVELDKTTNLKVRAFDRNTPSLAITEHAFLKHLALGGDIVLSEKYSPRYEASGDKALVDGLCGSDQFRDGMWQGYEQVDLDAVIDLGEERMVSRISTRFLQAIGSWIFLPKSVEYSLSIDNKSFDPLTRLTNDIPENAPGTLIKAFSQEWQPKKARYIRVHAENLGVCPAWHAGAGGKAWLFADEIVVE